MNLERIFENVLREGREPAMYRVGDIVENDERRRGTINSKWYDDDMEEYMYSVYYDEEDPDGYGDDEEELPESMVFNLIERPKKSRSSKEPKHCCEKCGVPTDSLNGKFSYFDEGLFCHKCARELGIYQKHFKK